MIKRFISKGMVGIPDCDIKLGNEKKIVITGPNGSGKTSLLKQITHPLASHDRINRLKPGVDEGYVEMELDFYGQYYKIQHLYNRTKPGQSPKVMSYLFKMIDNKYVNLVENGLPTNFKSVVEKELYYSDYMYPILNIGSHNQGLIEQTTANRLDYLKKVLNQDVLSQLKENVNNNFTQYSNNGKYISNEISKQGDKEDLIRRMKILQSESIELTNERDNYTKELAKLESIDLSVSEELNAKLNSYRNQLKQFDHLKRLLEDVWESPNGLTYNSLREKISSIVITLQTKINVKEEQISKLTQDLLEMKEKDNTELLKEKQELQDKYNEIIKRYKGKSFPDRDTNVINDSIYDIERIIIPLVEKIDGIAIAQELIKNKSYEYYGKSTLSKMDNLSNNIVKLKSDLDKLNFSKNLVELDYPEGCKFPKCKLRVEYENQVSNLNIYQILTENINSYELELEELQKQYTEEKNIKDLVIELLNNLKASSLLSVSKLYKEVKDYEFLDLNKVNVLVQSLKDHIMYNKDTNDLDKISSKLDSLASVVKASEDNTKDRLKSINIELDTLNEETKELRDNLTRYERDLRRIDSLEIEEEIRYLKYEDIEVNRKYKSDSIDELSRKIKELSDIDKNKDRLNSLIVLRNKDLKENTDAYYELKNKKERIELLTKDFENTQKHIEKLKVLKDIVGRVLPARIMDSYLFDVAKLVNYLLDGIMRIRFDTSDGIEIYSTIRAEERPASVMSQGEKSMLSVALLIAFKKMIKWDVISIDEGSAALDEDNTDRFMDMITKYIEAVDTVNQVFIVSHDLFVSDGMDIRVLKMENL